MTKPNTRVEMIDGKLWQFTTAHYTETVGEESKEGTTLCGLPTDELVLYHDAALFTPPPFPGVTRKRHVIEGCVVCMTDFFEAFKKVERQRNMWERAAYGISDELDTKQASIDMLKRAVRRNQRKADMLQEACVQYERACFDLVGTVRLREAINQKLEKKLKKAEKPKKLKGKKSKTESKVLVEDVELPAADLITVCDICPQNHPDQECPDPEKWCPLCREKGVQHICSSRIEHLNNVQKQRHREEQPTPARRPPGTLDGFL